MIDIEFTKRVINALRSENYKQTTGALRHFDCFCAEGVACDVYDSNRWDGNYYFGEGNLLCGYAMPCEISKLLPPKISLMHLNDAKRLDFVNIAQKLENALNEYTSTLS